MCSIVKSFRFDNKPIIIDTSRTLEKVETTNVLVKLQQDVDRLNGEIRKAKKEAEDVIRQAREEEARIREEVENFKADEMEKTRQICEEIKEDARREAFDKGYAEGKEEAAIRAKAILQSLEQVLQQALVEKDEIIKKAEQQIVQIAMAIAKKVTKCEVTMNRDIIFYSVNEAISKIVDRDTINIYMNLKDVKMFTQKKEDILKSLPIDSKVKVIEDNTVEPGGCVISTNMGNIDATISSQMFEIEKLLEESMRQEEGS